MVAIPQLPGAIILVLFQLPRGLYSALTDNTPRGANLRLGVGPPIKMIPHLGGGGGGRVDRVETTERLVPAAYPIENISQDR